MAIESIARVGSDDAALTQNKLGLEDFLKIFLTQLNFQDPLEPVDNREFIAQLAQFSSVEVANQTNSNIESLLDVQAISQTVGLIGKEVQVAGEQGFVVGRVTTISFDNGNPVMTLVTSTGESLVGVSPSKIQLVRNPAGN